LQRIGRAAVAALYDELALEPKPGLVSLADNGSHRDMMRARSCAACSPCATRFSISPHSVLPALTSLGLNAQESMRRRRMLKATGGINTHRGALFSIGSLCARQALLSRGATLRPRTIRHTLLGQWAPPWPRAPCACRLRRVPARHGALDWRQRWCGGRVGFPGPFRSDFPFASVRIA